jgi:hypothetical protein
MHFGAKPAGLLLLCFLAAGTVAQQKDQEPARVKPLAAKQNTSLHADPARPLLVNTSDGLSVIGAALESRSGPRSKTDCSHLVHAIYERAGFPYAYASSSDLYAGVDEFRQVKRPQPGDLVVWPGHVGIVVNPTEQSFFSALSSGLGVESYSTGYWKDRGRPRFYRYVKAGSASESEAKPGTPSLTRTSFDPKTKTETKPLPDSSTTRLSLDLSGVQVISGARPKTAEVAEALSSAFARNAEEIRGVDVFQLAQPVIVFSRFEVKEVKLKGNQGRVEVRITQALSLASGQANLKKQEVTQKLTLQRRDPNTWELSLPQNAINLSQDAAVQVLAHQLALLSDTDGTSTSTRQKAQLAQMLSTLLVK